MSKTDTYISEPTSLTGGVDINWTTFYTNTSGMANFFSGVTPANASSQVPTINIYSALNTGGAIPAKVWQSGNTTFSGTAGVQFSWTIPYTSTFTLTDGPGYTPKQSNAAASGGGTNSGNYPSLAALNFSLNAINLTFPVAGTYIYGAYSSSFVGVSGGGASTGGVLIPASHTPILTFNIT